MGITSSQSLSHLIGSFGYWAVLIGVMLESTGIPFPGETILILAGIYAGSTHNLQIELVIAAAAAGAIIGDNLGYVVGREGGFRLVRRYGHLVRLDERKLKLGQYIFMRHGGKVVFFGRFVSVLRAWAAFLAGVNRMHWSRFLAFNGLGGILWATIYGVGAYMLGTKINGIRGTVGIVVVAVVIMIVIAFFFFLRKNERRLEDEAERALPGPIEHYHYGTAQPRPAEAQGDGENTATSQAASRDASSADTSQPPGGDSTGEHSAAGMPDGQRDEAPTG
jgi:membrane protein DedA with SNARE-associated domain